MCSGDPSSCVQATCCEADPTKCGTTGVTCGASQYQDPAKAGASKNVPEVQMLMNCCTAKATCADIKCAVGTMANSSFSSMMCAGAASSCMQATCCEEVQCGATAVKCAAGKYQDSGKAFAAIGADGGAMACCTAVATCSSAMCGPGTQKDTSAASTQCSGAASSCMQATCCRDIKCSMYQVKCASGKYQDSAKGSVAIGMDNGVTSCCTTKATCAAACTVVATRIKPAASATMCTGAASSCDKAVCCEADPTKCGTTGVTCGANEYQDSTKAGNDKNETHVMDCCTAKATCAQAKCAAGMMVTTNATFATMMCNAGPSSCIQAVCCEQDFTKCGTSGISCGVDKYQDSAKAGVDKASSKTGGVAECCTSVATCANVKCAVGTKFKTSSTSMKCPGAASSCAQGTCCEEVKCSAASVKCGAGKYKDDAKASAAIGTDAGVASCCTAVATCSDIKCAAGTQVNAAAAEKMCTGGASTCVLKECCEADATKCGTTGVTCGAGTYQDSTKAAASRGSDKGVTACCTQKATCAIANCKVGDKRQVSVATFRCPGGVSSCVTDVGANPSCCVRDTRKDSTSKMDATVVVTDVSKFDLVKYKKAMETAIGADSTKNVTVTIKSIDIALVYDFSDTVTEIQAQTSIADSAGVPKTDVKVTLGRRLGNLQTGANLRRLAVTKVNAVITTADAAAATKVQGKVTSKAAGGFEATLAAALKTAGVTVTVTERVSPKISVKTEVTVRAKEGYVFKAPSAAAINTAAAAQGLTVVAEAVKVTVFGVTTTTKAPVPVPVPVAPSAVVVSDDSDGFPVWAIVIIILLVLGCVAVIVLGVLMSKKKAPAANKPPEEAPAAPAVVEEPKAPEPAAPAAPEPEAAAAEPEAAPAPVPEAAPAPVEEPPVVVPEVPEEALAPVEEQSPAVEENAASPDLNEIPIVLAEEAPVEESGLEISQIEEDARVPELSTVRGDVPAKSCFMCGC